MHARKTRALALSAGLATAISFIGWASDASHHVPHIGSLPGFNALGGVLAMPGILVEVLVAATFSPQGFHGGEQFWWVSLPANWLLYFFLFLAILLRRTERRTTPAPSNE